MKNLSEILEGCRKSDRQSQQLIFNNYKSLFLGIANRYVKDSEAAKDVVKYLF